MWRKLIGVMAFGVSSLAASQARADSLDLNLNDDSMRMTYEAAMGKGGAMDVGYYYNDRREGSDADLMHLGLHVTGDNWSQSGIFNIKVGGRLVYSNPERYDINLYKHQYETMALGLGGEVRFSPVHRLGFGASAYYAPRIASFLDAERYSEYGVKIDYQLLTQAFIYVGYRQINVEVEHVKDPLAVDHFNGKFELDDSAHVGLKLLF
ncbi:MAG TPA: YfaZ family outer membrane protein [Gammaproteobacteria bacterium]